MDTPRPTGDRVPLGDLTNTIHGDGNHNEHKRQRKREQYATMADEERSEINKKRCERYNMNSQGRVDLNNNLAPHSTDGNTTDEMDENSDWLHRQSTYNNSLELSSDILVPLSDTGDVDVDDMDTDDDISTVHETGSGYAPSPVNLLVTCPKERRRARDKVRKAAMSPGQITLRNKRRRELYAITKSAKMLELTPKETARIGIPIDTDDSLTSATAHEAGDVNASNFFDNTITCPKEGNCELGRARRAAMSSEQKALINKRRRDLYAHKNTTRKLQMTTEEKKLKRNESHKTYKRMVREHRANTLHLDSIAMESPHFNPQPIFPSSPQSRKATSLDMEIPEFGGTPVYIVSAVVQNLEVETTEFDAAHTIHRPRVTSGERNALMSRRNQAFEANIGRKARGCANGEYDDANDPTHPSVVYNDGVTQESSVPPPINCSGTQTQPSVIDGASPMPQNGAQADTPDSMVEDDYNADVIFEDDEEEEAYFFAGQEYDEDANEIEHNDDTDEQENNEPDVPDPYDRVYANVPSESHKLPSVSNCKHGDTKKFEGEPPGFCCRGGKIHLSTPETPPELMRL